MEVREPKKVNTMDVFSLISSPSYSPTALRHLPQPVPNDLPPEVDASVFTFEDAFEDLLAVSQGQKLPDIHSRHQQRQLLQDMFPSGEPAWFWLRRLESQGLVQVPSRSEFFRSHQPDWPSFHDELDRRAADVWHSVSNGYRKEDAGSGDFFEELGKAFKQLERGFLGESTRNDDVDRKDKTQQGKEPDTFEELFSEISSKFRESTSSWDTFIKTITEDAKTRSSGEKSQPQHNSHDGNKVVATEDEYVDRFGYMHKTVTRKTLDANGNEVGSETFVTIRPAGGHLDNETTDESEAHETLGNQTETKKSSWFWK